MTSLSPNSRQTPRRVAAWQSRGARLRTCIHLNLNRLHGPGWRVSAAPDALLKDQNT